MGSEPFDPAGAPKQMRPALLVVAVAAVATVAAVVAQAYTFATLDVVPQVPERLVVVGLAGWAFVVSGLVAIRERPASRVGQLMVLIGVLWLTKEILALPWTIVLLPAAERMTLALLAVLILTFPSGRLSGWERPAAAVWFGWIALGSLVQIPFDHPWPPRCDNCPTHPLFIRHEPELLSAVGDVTWYGVVAMMAVLVVVLVSRWRSASQMGRRHVSRLGLAVGPVLLAAVAVPASAQLIGFPSLTAHQNVYIGNLALIALPLLILTELLRSRLSHARVSDLVRRLAGPVRPGELQGLLAQTLDDPRLQLGFRQDDGSYIDAAGAIVELPHTDTGQVVTRLDEGEPGAVVVHDDAVDADLVRAAAVAARLSLDNERLHAQVHAQLGELRRSSARIVAAADRERQRVERDLHDGAQQRIVALAMGLDRIRVAHAESLDPSMRGAIDEAINDATEAVSDLRRLARGVYPPLLTEQGLSAALESFSDRSTVPVLLDVPERRYPADVEIVTFFVVAEALTNAAKHAEARCVRVVLRADGDALVVHVSDDGRGGADPAGHGLQGLRDRVEAGGGSLSVRDAEPSGTVVRAELPLGDE